MRHFPVGWSTKLKLTTLAFLGILIYVSFAAGSGGSILAVALLLITLAFSVRGYSIQDGTLHVHRFGWSTKFNLADLTSVELAPYATLGSIRTFGIGGVFGYIGRFSNGTLGAYQAYVTDGARTVVLQFGEKTVVVSPADPAAFVSSLTAEAPAQTP
ncbi:MAG: PH domain-containing protein [Bacteroidota bacterium]